MAKKYVVKITAEERGVLEHLVKKGKAAGWKLQRAQALRKGDQGPEGPAWRDAHIAEAFGGTTRAGESWRKQAVERGPLARLERTPRLAKAARKFAGDKTARLVAWACAQPPKGQARWSLRLRAARGVAREIVDTGS